MTGEYVFRPEADRDLDEYHQFIARDSLRAADRFVTAAYDDCQKLADMPGMAQSDMLLTGACESFAHGPLMASRIF